LVKTAVVGARGYAGLELARLLLAHPRLAQVPPLFLGREGGSLADLAPQLVSPRRPGTLAVQPFSWELLAKHGVKILFLATPHEQSREWVPEALASGLRVIDLSGAWRLKNDANRAVYKFADDGRSTQARAVYGLPELHRTEIVNADLVANPGCYATSIILALKPLIAAGLVDLDRGVISDSKSGVSGAGREATATTHFMYAADNLSAYGVFKHRHLGELLEQLDITDSEIIFTPHLLPIPRGILSTIYVTFLETTEPEAVETCYREYYADSPLVRVYPTPQLPQIQYSVRTNYADIGFELAREGRRCVVVSCLDNLLKGAASQAVQNMNLMCGWDESEGLL
jgi:N-acetyl-gamma-glutamyl-phosphate reductase